MSSGNNLQECTFPEPFLPTIPSVCPFAPQVDVLQCPNSSALPSWQQNFLQTIYRVSIPLKALWDIFSEIAISLIGLLLCWKCKLCSPVNGILSKSFTAHQQMQDATKIDPTINTSKDSTKQLPIPPVLLLLPLILINFYYRRHRIQPKYQNPMLLEPSLPDK